MLDIKFLRENPTLIKEQAKNKRVTLDIDTILKIDSEYQALNTKIQELRMERNAAAKEKNIERGKAIKTELETLEKDLLVKQDKRSQLLNTIPNVAKPDVKIGRDDTENDIIKTYKSPTVFTFTPKDHLELGEALDIIDITRASKVSGTRFAYLKNDGVLLEFALVQYAFETLLSNGFTPIIPPVLVKREVMQGLGYMENGGEEDMFVTQDDLFLVGTAEHALVPMYANETFIPGVCQSAL